MVNLNGNTKFFSHSQASYILPHKKQKVEGFRCLLQDSRRSIPDTSIPMVDKGLEHITHKTGFLLAQATVACVSDIHALDVDKVPW